MDDKLPLKMVRSESQDPFQNFGAQIISLERVKLGTSNMMYGLILMSISSCVIDYPEE